uniref:X-linked retinitis pigmentosa GTPase regulator n=1 Tax=Denticeps clupeoides TaxID=299321 RepID=A0AAY4BJU4_9TELE
MCFRLCVVVASGALFTLGSSNLGEDVPSRFWLRSDRPARIACGDAHTALVTERGRLYVFGSNSCGQLGLNAAEPVNKPTCVKGLGRKRVTLVACGKSHTILSTTRDVLYATGGNSDGQLGLGHHDDRATFQPLRPFCDTAPIRMLAAGCNTSAALTDDGRLFMWGDNSAGQLGMGAERSAPCPRAVAVGRPVTWVSCGTNHSAVVTDAGDVFTFGSGAGGRLGVAPEQPANDSLPRRVNSLRCARKVACGGEHTVVLTDEGLFSFGRGVFGQLGLGTFVFEADVPSAVCVTGMGRPRHVTCGENHTAIVTEEGLLYTFGDGRHGKLGQGDENFANQFVPTLCQRFLKYHINIISNLSQNFQNC